MRAIEAVEPHVVGSVTAPTPRKRSVVALERPLGKAEIDEDGLGEPFTAAKKQ
jgi:hypothetical protein